MWVHQEGDWHITWRIRWRSRDICTMCTSCLRRLDADSNSRRCGERKLEWSSRSAQTAAWHAT